MAVFSAIGNIVGAKSNRKAAKQVAADSRATNEANNALAREVYGQNRDILNPYVQRGNAAGNAMNALLGLGGAQPIAQPTTQPNAFAQFAGSGYGEPGIMPSGAPVQTWGGQAPPMGMQGGMGTPQQAADSAFDIFRNSTGYQFRLGEGMNALNSGYAAAGTLQSGAAMRDAVRYGQDYASNEFGNYMGYLGNQQGVGLGAGSALAGVGQNYVNTISSNNNIANANIANANLARAANNPWAIGLQGIGQAAQQVGGFALGGGFG